MSKVIVISGAGSGFGALSARALADASQVSEEIARIVALPDGKRPFRTHIDPADDGAEAVSTVADRIHVGTFDSHVLAVSVYPGPGGLGRAVGHRGGY